MRKALWVLAVILPTLFAGCEQNSMKKFDNPQQQAFDDFLAKKRESSYRQNNDIQKKEYYNQFEKELFSYVDSVGLFVNWQGIIEKIETTESGNTTALKFSITYQPEQYRKITFRCTHLITTDSLNTDYVYNTVKNMPNYTVVYFDGFIRTKNNDEIDYYMSSAGSDLNISYPDYEFWITDISPEKRDNLLSPKMQNAVSVAYKINNPLKKQYMGLITKEESDRQFSELLPSFNQAKSELTDSEKQYIQRLNTCLTYNYLYGGK